MPSDRTSVRTAETPRTKATRNGGASVFSKGRPFDAAQRWARGAIEAGGRRAADAARRGGPAAHAAGARVWRWSRRQVDDAAQRLRAYAAAEDTTARFQRSLRLTAPPALSAVVVASASQWQQLSSAGLALWIFFGAAIGAALAAWFAWRDAWAADAADARRPATPPTRGGDRRVLEAAHAGEWRRAEAPTARRGEAGKPARASTPERAGDAEFDARPDLAARFGRVGPAQPVAGRRRAGLFAAPRAPWGAAAGERTGRQDAILLSSRSVLAWPDASSAATELLEAVPASLILLDGRGFVAFANTAAEADAGRPVHGRHFSTVMRAPALVDAVERCFERREPTEADFTLHRVLGREFRALVRPLQLNDAVAASAQAASPMSPPLRGWPHVLVMLQDQTRIRRAERLRRDFVANASHELKTPLAVLSGLIETLGDAAREDPEARERFLDMMAHEADRMRQLVDDLLSLNRIELNEHVRPEGVVDLPTVAQQAVEAARRSAVAKSRLGLAPAPSNGSDAEEGVIIEPLSAAAPRRVVGDARQLEQVVHNLVENALKYGSGRRPAAVRFVARAPAEHGPKARNAVGVVDSAARGRARVGVEVEDYGAGIAKEHLPRLTERFYRVDGSGARAQSGTGLGLAIVKHIVSRHRGELEIDSRLGRGSRFTVWLPAADAEAERAEAARAVRAEGATRGVGERRLAARRRGRGEIEPTTRRNTPE